MKFKVLFFCVVFFNVAVANAQYNFTKIDNWLNNYTPQMGGRAILMIYKDGKIVYTHAVNQLNRNQRFLISYLAKRQNQTPDFNDYGPDTRQRIASCSKWLSAALVMTFVDEGKLKLTDTVGKYLPVLSRNGKGNITIENCLSHLTAIKAPSLKDNLAEMREDDNMDDAINQIAKLPMEGQPGKVFHYSNVGLQIAGAVIEKISGKTFETLFAERIAGPLGMTNTDFGKGKVALPAGGAISTTRDYLNFLVMILNKGNYNGRRILSEKSITTMQLNRITNDVKIAYSPAEGGNFGYALGEWVVDQNVVTSPGLFGSFPWVNNNKKYAAFLLTYYLNNSGRNGRYLELRKLVDDAIDGKE